MKRSALLRHLRYHGSSGRPLNFTVSSHVDRLHVVVTAALALCGAGVLMGVIWKLPGLTALSVFLGYWSSLVAITIALLLIIVLGYRSLSGTAVPLFKRSWLGLLNGALAVGSWVYSVL